MAKRNAAGSSKSSLCVNEPDDRPDAALNNTVKRRRMCVIAQSYNSPLVHFKRSKSQPPAILDDLDDSIVVVEEVTGLPLAKNSTSSTGKKKCTAGLDESVIILSDNEENSVEKETDVQLLSLRTVVKGDLSRQNSQPAGLRKVRRKPKSRVRTKTITSQVTSLEKKSSISGSCSDSNTLELQSISIDSEDENTSPNDDSSRSHPQAEIIIIDNSLTETGTDVSMSTIPSSSSPGGSVRTATTQDNVSMVFAPRQESQTRAEQSAPLGLEKSGTCPAFCIDTKGDPSLAYPCLKIPNPKNRKVKKKNGLSKAIVPVSSGKTAVTDQPQGNGIGSYYSEDTVVKTPGSLREIIIDGCNIAMQYTNGRRFSEEGLKLVIDFFKLRGHTVKAFVPQHVRSPKNVLLEKLYLAGDVVFTPSRLIGGKRISSYDDRYILDYAVMSEGIVVSQDQYRDLYNEKPAWEKVIEERLLVPTFAGKCVMFPEDPLGRRGPRLDEFLRH